MSTGGAYAPVVHSPGAGRVHGGAVAGTVDPMTTTLTARRPEDLLALVPLVLGFRPAESLVMLTFGGVRAFHARLDLPPPDARLLAEVAESLVTPALVQEVHHVAFVVYSQDATLAAALGAALVPTFLASGIGVVDVLRTADGHWCSVPVRAGAQESEPVPYDDSGHPFHAHAVFEGMVTRASREELRELVAPDQAVRSRLDALLGSRSGPSAVDADVVHELLARLVTTGADPGDDEAAQVLSVVCRVDVRDAAIAAVTAETAREHLRVWAALLRGAPDAQVADVAAVTAFCAWQCGDGALAWCALDRCFEVDPRHPLGTCLAACLEHAVAPSAWEEAGHAGCA